MAAVAIDKATGGKVDLFKDPKISAIAAYPQKLGISKRGFVCASARCVVRLLGCGKARVVSSKASGVLTQACMYFLVCMGARQCGETIVSG